MKYLHIDSLNGATFSTNPNNSTYYYVDGNVGYSPNDYNLIVTLPQAITGVQKIYLKSVCTPWLVCNVRASSLLNFINVDIGNNTVRKIVLGDAIYNSIDNLISDLNTASNVLFPADALVFSIDSTTGCLKVYSSVNATVKVLDTNLAYMLGFRENININSANTCFAQYLYNLSVDMYVNVYISNLSTGFNPNTNRTLSSFTVPITAGSYSINFSSSNLNFDEYIIINEPYKPITELHIQLTDCWGYSLNSRGSRLILTLALDG